MDLSSYMQLKCGQCGKHLVVPVPGSAIETVRCDACEHEINVRVFTKGANFETLNSKVEFQTDQVEFAELAKKALRERLIVSCIHCAARLKISKRLAGQDITCAVCNNDFTVPILYDDAEFDRFLNPAAAAAAQLSGKITSLSQQSIRRANMQKNRARKQLFRGIIALVATAVIVIAGLFYFKKLAEESSEMPGDPNAEVSKAYASRNNSGNNQNRNNAGNSRDKASGNSNNGASNNAGNVGTQNPPTSISKPSKVSILGGSVAWATSVDDRFFPKPGHLFVIVKTVLKSNSKPVSFKNSGESVCLKIGQKKYFSLGAPTKAYLLPKLAEKKSLTLTRAEDQKAEFLFEVPAKTFNGSIEFSQFKAKINVSLPLEKNEKLVLAGEYIEKSPRRINPFCSNKVQEAIVSVPNQKIEIVKTGTGRLLISLPRSDVFGNLTPAGSWGVYHAKLAKGKDKLDAILRIIPCSNKCVLSLDKERTKEICFSRTKKSQPRQGQLEGGVFIPKTAPSENTKDKTQGVKDLFFGDQKTEK